jgi:retinol dehydrogenase-16
MSGIFLVASLAGLFIVYKLLDRILRIPYISDYQGRYILITGCSSGFGLEAVKRLDSLGCHVFAGCRRQESLDELKKICSERVMPILIDIRNPDSVRKAFKVVTDRLTKDGQELWCIVNNAGVACPIGPPEWFSIDDYKNTLDVNLYGTIDVTMTFLPLVKRSRGRVVNVSSAYGRVSAWQLLPYSLSKYGIEAFSDGLRRSLRPYGCTTVLLEPGYFKTNIISQGNLQDLLSNGWNAASDEMKEEYGEDYFRYLEVEVPKQINILASGRLNIVTDAFEHAILGRYPQARYVIGADIKFLFLPVAVLPERLGDWILAMLDRSKPLPAILRKK